MPAPADLHAMSAEQLLELQLHAAPAGFYLSADDNLRVSSLASTSAPIVVSGLMLGLDGVPRPFSMAHTPTTDRVIGTTSYLPGPGWLLNVTARVSGTTPIIGQVWLRLDIVRGSGAGAFVIAALASGYVTSQQSINWPNGRIRDTLEGHGAIRTITGTDPAAGAEVLETVPTGAVWRVLMFRVVFTTDATAANRFPQLVISDGTFGKWNADPPVAQTASLTRTYNFGPGTTRIDAANQIAQWSYPNDALLRGGYTVQTVTVNLQAGDNYGAPQLLVEEWPEGA